MNHRALGPRLTLEFKQAIRGAPRPWAFLAPNMSDGTIRALGILVALFQAVAGPRRVRLVAVEEPEVALHPAAAGVLLDALRDASGHAQVLVTSHSPELLDSASIQGPETPSSSASSMRRHEDCANSWRGKRGLPGNLEVPPAPEDVHGAKEWLSQRMAGTHGYRPTIDQAALAHALDFDVARRGAESFDKFFRDTSGLLRGDHATTDDDESVDRRS